MARGEAKDLLAEYKARRDFAKTPEPGPKRSKAKGNNCVIQKHAATRTHFDFRLEKDGVLKSWAVTKGPSLDPAEKRLAVRTEDHPLEYGGFEGVIPKGEYGGGPVMIWDRGTWEPIGDPDEGLAKGDLKFHLRGERLKGDYVLVRMKKDRTGGKRDLRCGLLGFSHANGIQEVPGRRVHRNNPVGAGVYVVQFQIAVRIRAGVRAGRCKPDQNSVVPSAAAGSKASSLTSNRALASKSLIGPARASARGVGKMPCEERTNNWSENAIRNRCSMPDTVGWVTERRPGARVTLRSSISASKTHNRFMSILLIFATPISSIA